MILIFSPGEKPNIRSYGQIKKISIYGNGLVSGLELLGIHHALIVLRTAERDFILLEVEKCDDNRINIHMERAQSLTEVLTKRLNTEAIEERWKSDGVNTRSVVVQRLIDNYHGKTYHPLTKSCRTFVDEVCKACDSKMTCGGRWSLC